MQFGNQAVATTPGGGSYTSVSLLGSFLAVGIGKPTEVARDLQKVSSVHSLAEGVMMEANRENSGRGRGRKGDGAARERIVAQSRSAFPRQKCGLATIETHVDETS